MDKELGEPKECVCGCDRFASVAKTVRVEGGGVADVWRCKKCRTWRIVTHVRVMAV